MSRKNIYIFLISIVIVFLTWFYTHSREKSDAFSKRVKVSLRNVGNQLLITNNDSTSIVLPIVLDKATYKLSFQNQLSIEPKDLVNIFENTFQNRDYPNHYFVEVKNCSNKEVAYSYEMDNNRENSIIPCFGRILPKSCYIIELSFNNTNHLLRKTSLVFALVVAIFLIILLKNRNISSVIKEDKTTNSTIGSFKFFPEQNLLIKDDLETKLSNKECEILSIFVTKPNQIIKREELTKKVWEDKGVIVGRSLDTYISKLRKKLQTDSSIKLINIHGIGYKLEIVPS